MDEHQAPLLRVCKICLVPKPFSEFYLNASDRRKGRNPRYDSYCRSCRSSCNRNASELRLATNPARELFGLGKRSAKNRGLAWGLTREQFAELRSKKCFYCGHQLPERGTGLDRINNELGYVVGNVLPCCTTCNVSRNDKYTVSEHLMVMTKRRNEAKLKEAGIA